MILFDEFNIKHVKYFDGESSACAAVGSDLKADALVWVSFVAHKD
jgi:hypothetical protein